MTRAHGKFGLIRIIVLMLATLGTGATLAQSSTTASSWSREADLTSWLDDELAPYLARTLAQHPRFKGESLRFVSARDELTRSITLRLRDRLQDTAGIRLWSVPIDGGPGGCHVKQRPDYDIGIEIERVSRERHRVTVRALDVAERHWVSGFGKHWEGRLMSRERDMLADRSVVPASPGTRERPFDEAQVDLLAKSLAQDLHYELCARRGDVAAVYLARDPEISGVAARVVRLLRHNLAAARDVTMVEDPAAATVHLEMHIEAIDGALHQVWIRSAPVGSEAWHPDIGAQAYLNLPRGSRTMARVRETAAPAALVSLAVLTPAETRYCNTANPWRHGEPVARPDGQVAAQGCFALDIQARDDIRFFVLTRDARHGPQRLFPSACRTFGRTRSVLVRGERLQFPLPNNARRRVLRAPDGTDSQQILVVAATDHKAAAALEAQLNDWRDACARSGERDPTDASRRLDRLTELVQELDGRARIERLDIRFVGAEARLATAEATKGHHNE